MLKSLMNFLQTLAGFSLLGCVECTSIAIIFYYIYAKTRAPTIIASLFPNLNLNINYYKPSLNKFNSMGNELLGSLRSSTKSETKSSSALAHGYGTQNMLEVTPHAGRRPYQSWFDWGVYFQFIAQNCRIKKFNYPKVSHLVEKDPLLNHALRQSTEQIIREQKLNGKGISFTAAAAAADYKNIDEESETYLQILKQQEKRAMSVLKNMRSTINNILLTLTSWLLYKLLPCFLSGVVTHRKQIEMLKSASERAPGIPLIFLPLHRSHLDYLLVTFILANYDIRSPLVAAGDNLQIPVFGGLLRGLGAFFIKRKIDPVVGKKDIVYRAVLHLYLQHALKLGHNVEFFIEGGRTRTGKPCMPKGGILSVIVNAFMDGSIPDALLVPVSVNYERLVDGNFVREQKGEKKVPESFKNAISGIWKTLNSKYGLMRIDFNEPYSIRELVQSYNKITKDDVNLKVYKPADRVLKHNQSTSSLYGTDVICEEHRNLIDSISRQVVFDCAAATSVMSTNALSFLFLTRFRNGALDTTIAEGLDKLRRILKGRKDLGFSGDSMHIINYACDLLGKDLVTRIETEEKDHFILRPVHKIESYIELSYYSNMLIPHFALESIVLITFHSLLPSSTTKKQNAQTISVKKTDSELIGTCRSKVIAAALQNCEILRYEFILNKPTQTLENLLENTLDELILNGLIKQMIKEEADTAYESRKIARHLQNFLNESEDEDYSYLNVENKDILDIFFAEETIEEQRVLCEVLAPFSSTYLAVTQSLCILYKNSMLESDFIKFVIDELTQKVNSGNCAYAECISTDSVRNCMKLMEKWSVIEICNEHGLRLVSLGTLYDVSKSSLKTVIDRIAGIMPNYKSSYFQKCTKN